MTQLQTRLAEARQNRDWDAVIAIENELGSGELSQQDAPEQGNFLEAGTPVLEDVTTGELLPQVEESDAVQDAPAPTKRKK